MPEVVIRADFSQFGRFAKSLDKANATVFRAAIRTAVKGAGAKMLADARSNASWSSTIPAATTLRTSFGTRSAGVRMRTNPRTAPHAYYYERGSKNSGGRYVKHPVYGSQKEDARSDVRARYDNKSTWRQTPTRKFFFKAGVEGQKEFVKELESRLDTVIRELGYHA